MVVYPAQVQSGLNEPYSNEFQSRKPNTNYARRFDSNSEMTNLPIYTNSLRFISVTYEMVYLQPWRTHVCSTTSEIAIEPLGLFKDQALGSQEMY